MKRKSCLRLSGELVLNFQICEGAMKNWLKMQIQTRSSFGLTGIVPCPDYLCLNVYTHLMYNLYMKAKTCGLHCTAVCQLEINFWLSEWIFAPQEYDQSWIMWWIRAPVAVNIIPIVFCVVSWHGWPHDARPRKKLLCIGLCNNW